MTSPYKVPLIPQNLSKEETVVQIAEVLNYLSEVTEDVFKMVNRRLEGNARKLGEIQDRIDASAAKINSLKGAKKATQVFSSSKYPAADLQADYVSIFDNSSKLELKRHQVKHSNYSSAYEPLSKLQFYHVKVEENKKKVQQNGLGEMPSNINCVNDLLLYNTGKNLYQDFAMADSLRGIEDISRYENFHSSEIGAAPASLSQRSTMSQSNTKDYFYAPKIEELPALDVPLDLPDLPGIADDLRYQSDINLSIAPSALTTNLLNNVPDDLPSVIETETTNTDGQKAPDIIPPPIEEIAKPPPIEELPPPNEVPLTQKEPPTKIPIAQPRTSGQEEKDEKVTLKQNLPPQTDLHSSLMEAIRQAGGSQKLKSRSTETNMEQEQGQNKSGPVPGGDLMADLHNKLLMRRKGISGAKKPEDTPLVPSDTTFGRISAMIPAPSPKIAEGETTSTDEEEWNE